MTLNTKREELLRGIFRVRRLLPQFKGTTIGDGLQDVLRKKERALRRLNLEIRIRGNL
jgi:hypothetical protein